MTNKANKAQVTVWTVEYSDGSSIDHPGSATLAEIRRHMQKCNGTTCKLQTKTVIIPETSEIIAETLIEFDIEPTRERIAQYYSLLNDRSALRQWIEKTKT